MNIYKSMGLEWLLEKDAKDALEMHISENTRYMVPGYQYNYRLCTFADYVEFQRCELPDGTPVKTDMHFCGDHGWQLEVENILKEDVSAPIYALKTNSGEDIPVRVLCPDVLASIENGDMLKGQVVAFADMIFRLDDDVVTDGKVMAAGEECVTFNGTIHSAYQGIFKLGQRETQYWELDVSTENGMITVVAAESSFSFTPDCDMKIAVHAMLSMDVAIEHRKMKDAVFYTDPYKNVIADADEQNYRNGFLLDYHRNQKALIHGIVTRNLSRVSICFADMVDFIDDYGTLDVGYKDRTSTLEALRKKLPQHITKVEVQHILRCEQKACIGHDGIVVSCAKGVETVIWFDVDHNGQIDRIAFFTPDQCSLGIDHEFHLHAMCAHAICDQKPYLLHEYLTNGCMYRSEYADICLVGAQYIADRFADIDTRLDETTSYTFEHALAKDELLTDKDLPKIYQGKYCTVQYQGDKLAYVSFLLINEDHKIYSVLMSRNADLLKRFAPETVSEPEAILKKQNLVDVLAGIYGAEDTLCAMRTQEIPDEDPDCVYVWKKADEFTRAWLKERDYKVSETVLTNDCIGYACERRGTLYAVFMYAYGKQKTVILSGDSCSKLRDEPIAKNREILIVYLQVSKTTNEDGGTEYKVNRYDGADGHIDSWLLTTVMGRNILQFYPRKEMVDMIPRLICAYNTKNLDALRVLCDKNLTLETFERSGVFVNDGAYSCLANIRQNHGKMKLAYIRYNDVVFNAVPYIENYAYLSFAAGGKIERLKMNPMNGTYRELLILDDDMDACAANAVPKLCKAEYLQPSDIARFSIRLTFDNGEIRRFDLAGDFKDEEVVKYQGKVLTDKIFVNGRIEAQLPLPDWMGYRNYAPRGQGIRFVSGITLSVEELYHDSYPIGTFSYASMADVHVLQRDYDEDGFGVGYILNMDPTNPNYLFDRNTMTAKVLPKEYLDTPIGVYPFYGGYSEGLVMVSKFGQLDLQYHHNRRCCAGLWGWLDTDLNVVIEPKYIYALNFVDGRAIVCKGEWEIVIEKSGEQRYWCENEQWGVIDKTEHEIVPCRFDELYEIDNTDRLYFVHEGGWENGHYAVFDTEVQEVILALDFDFDIGYMFNECFVMDDGLLVFDNHRPGEEQDLLYVYDLKRRQYVVHGESLEGRTFNGETRVVVERDGQQIIVF